MGLIRWGRRGVGVLVGALMLGILAACGSGASTSPNAGVSAAASSQVRSAPGAGKWITYARATRSVWLTLVAGYGTTLGGMNFNGFGQGRLVVVFPSGWHVTVDFINRGQLPHSVAIVGGLPV